MLEIFNSTVIIIIIKAAAPALNPDTRNVQLMTTGLFLTRRPGLKIGREMSLLLLLPPAQSANSLEIYGTVYNHTLLISHRLEVHVRSGLFHKCVETVSQYPENMELKRNMRKNMTMKAKSQHPNNVSGRYQDPPASVQE